MELVDYLRVLRRRWRVIAATVVLALVAAWATTPADASPQQQVPVGTSYRATHTLLQAADTATPANLELTSLFATTGDIPRRAAVRLGRPAEEGPLLATRVTVTPDAKLGSLAVTVSGGNGPEVAAIANAFAAEIVETLRSTAERDRGAQQAEAAALVEQLGDRVAQLQTQIASSPSDAPLLEAQRDAYLKNYAQAFSRLQELSSQGEVRSPLATLEEATPVPTTTSSVLTPPSSRTGRLGLAALLGLALGVLLALVLERLDRRLRTREAIEDITALPVVAEVPVLPRPARRDWSIPAVSAPASAVAEAYRSLRSAIMLVPSRPALQQPGRDVEWKTPQVLLITSPLPADGKTSTVANLAACLAESGRRVLVLDCDFRNPTLHRYFRVPTGRGISDLLAGTSDGELSHVVRHTAVPGVQLVTSGGVTSHPAALLARAGDLLDGARRLADVVLIDAAPVLVANDATDLVPYVDAVVLVARSGRTTHDHATRTTELLARLSVPIAGTVLVGSSGTIPGYRRRTAVLSSLGSRRRRWATEPPAEWSGAAARPSRRARPRDRSRDALGAPAVPAEPAAAEPVEQGTGWPDGRRPHGRTAGAPDGHDAVSAAPHVPRQAEEQPTEISVEPPGRIAGSPLDSVIDTASQPTPDPRER